MLLDIILEYNAAVLPRGISPRAHEPQCIIAAIRTTFSLKRAQRRPHPSNAMVAVMPLPRHVETGKEGALVPLLLRRTDRQVRQLAMKHRTTPSVVARWFLIQQSKTTPRRHNAASSTFQQPGSRIRKHCASTVGYPFNKQPNGAHNGMTGVPISAPVFAMYACINSILKEEPTLIFFSQIISPISCWQKASFSNVLHT